MSPMTTAAPARASASAIPAPRPRAPPVTRALRPVKSYTLILASPPRDGSGPGPCDVGHSVTRSGQSSRLSWTLVKVVLGRDETSRYSWFRHARCEPPRTDGNRCDRRGGDEPGADLAAPGRQVRRAAGAAGRRRAADAGRARLRPDQPAGDRAELPVLARCAALLLQRQTRPAHPLRAPVRGRLRHPLRRDRGHGQDGAGAEARVQRGDGADPAHRRADAPAVV